MKRINILKAGITLILFCIFLTGKLSAQSKESDVKSIVLHKDSLFWKDYNTCNISNLRTFFSDDVEFYHDKGGATFGLQALVDAFKKGMCNEQQSFRLRREAVKGTVKIFLLQNNNVVYGAIISGEHVFYIVQNGKETLDGHGIFTNIWMLKDGEWKMTRVLSYDHGPAVQPK
ncbi:MAG: nuclear transport factor 2 family protein [Chitinophagaceae bacterium]